MHHLLLLALTLTLPGLRAGNGRPVPVNFCAADFGAVAGGPNVPLIESTYRDLLAALGTKLSPESLKALAENPFVVPEQTGVDLSELGRKLLQFEAMLKERGWRTPDVVAKLSAQLKTLAEGSAQAKDRVAEVLVKTVSDFDFDFRRDNTIIQQSPDGRYLIAADKSHSTDWKVVLYDRQTRQKVTLPGNGMNSQYPQFSTDGKSVLVPLTGGYAVQVAPFHDGKIDWTKAKTIGADTGAGNTWLVHQGKSADCFVGAGEGPRVFRYDVGTGAKVPVDLYGFVKSLEHEMAPDPSVEKWGYIPGTDHFYVIYNVGARFLVTATLSPDGKLTELDKRGMWDDRGGAQPTDAAFSKDGKTFYLWEPKSGGLYTSKAREPEPFFSGAKAPKVNYVAVNPVTGEIAVAIPGKGIEIRDGNTREVKNMVPFTGPLFAAEFSNDGGSLIIASERSDSKMRNVNYRQWAP